MTHLGSLLRVPQAGTKVSTGVLTLPRLGPLPSSLVVGRMQGVVAVGPRPSAPETSTSL